MKIKFKSCIFILSCFLMFFLLQLNTQVNAQQVSWGYEATNMTSFFEKTKDMSNEEIVVVVIDLGIDPNHSWFKTETGESRIVGGAFCNPQGCVDETYDDEVLNYIDDSTLGHGTHVAGIIAKSTPDNVKILPIKVEKDAHGIDHTTMFKAFIHVLALTIKYNIKVVNYSMEIGTTEMCSGQMALYYYSLAAYPLYLNDILIVSAAGNLNTDTKASCLNHYDEVVVVSAMDNQFKKSSISNYGDEVDFAAPGVGIYSAQRNSGEYAVHPLTGTSQAAPHVSANIALLYNACPTCSMKSIEDILLHSAKDLGDSGKDKYFGHGYIDMEKSYAYLSEKFNNIKVIVQVAGVGTAKSTASGKSINGGLITNNSMTFNVTGKDTIIFTPAFLFGVKKFTNGITGESKKNLGFKAFAFTISQPTFSEKEQTVSIYVRFSLLNLF